MRRDSDGITASTKHNIQSAACADEKNSHAMTARGGASIDQLPIYPYYCRGLSATLGRWCPFTARDVHALQQVDGFAGMYAHRAYIGDSL